MILFSVTYYYYSVSFIKENVEDIAFDTINKFIINTSPTNTPGAHVLLFAIDDLYMKTHHLYDERNQSNYGYFFPRDHIADFIEKMDTFVSEIDGQNIPKALFIDYDMSFSSLPYGKELSIEDKKLLKV